MPGVMEDSKGAKRQEWLSEVNIRKRSESSRVILSQGSLWLLCWGKDKVERIVGRLLKQMRNDGDPDSRFCTVGFWICFEGRALNLYCCVFKKSILFLFVGWKYELDRFYYCFVTFLEIFYYFSLPWKNFESLFYTHTQNHHFFSGSDRWLQIYFTDCTWISF